MPQTAKERNKRWLPVVFACAVFIGAAMWASVLIPQGSARTTAPSAAPSDYPQWLTVRDGQLTLMAGDKQTVLGTYDAAVASLPPDEQARLQGGVRVEDEAMLAALLENYLS